MHIESFEEIVIITRAVEDSEWRLGSQSNMIADHRSLIERLRGGGYLQQNGDNYSLSAAGYRAFRRLGGRVSHLAA